MTAYHPPEGERRRRRDEPDPCDPMAWCWADGCTNESPNFRCGCCGAPLCGRHHETGGGFCPAFEAIANGIPACIRDGEITVGAHMVRPDGEDVPSVLLLHVDLDHYHLPAPDDYNAPTEWPERTDQPLCGQGGRVKDRIWQPLPDVAGERDLCPHCEKVYLDLRLECEDCGRGFDTVDRLDDHACLAAMDGGGSE